MAVTADPVLAYENLVDAVASTLSSSDVEADSAIGNLAKPALDRTTDFGTGTAKAFVLDCGSAKSVGCVYLRFRGTGWSDITTVRIRGSANSNLSAPDYDVTTNEQFPTTWANDMPRRPIFVKVFDAVSARYWGIDIARTAGSADLLVARAYIGPAYQLSDLTTGFAVYGSAWSVETGERDNASDVDVDNRFVRSQRRVRALKIEGSSDAHVKDERYQKLMYACASRDVLYVDDPTETDSGRIQTFTIWGKASAGEAISTPSYNFWEQTLKITERL